MNNSEFDNIFYGLTKDMELSHEGLKEYEPLDELRDQILSRLAEHMEPFLDVDVADIDEMLATMDTIMEFLNTEFMSDERLGAEEEIIATGNTIFMLVDDDTLDTTAITLSDGIQLRGTVHGFTFLDIPDIRDLEYVRNPDTDYEASNLTCALNVFGLGLVFNEAKLLGRDSDTPEIPMGSTVVIPLNYPQVRLMRVKAI